MASDASTLPAAGTVQFTPDFVAHLPAYQKAIRGHRVAGWARERGLLDDLVQLALIDLARVESRFDPKRATSHHHYRMAVLGSRVYDCFDFLKRMHGDAFGHRGDDAEDFADDDHIEMSTDEVTIGDTVFADATLAELVRELAEFLDALPTVQRRVLELALVDHSDREIAEHLGVSIQAVHTARKKGLAKLQAALQSSHYIN
jgi:RNA polymerase sigma factor (sigma-70 family)